MKQLGIFIISALCLFSCAHEEAEWEGPGSNPNLLTLTYTIPDAIAGGGSARADGSPDFTRAVNYVESTANESVVSGLHLLFFNSDAHGNGTFVASASAGLKDSDLKQNSITVILPSAVQPANEYAVLVIANLANSITNSSELDAYLASFSTKTYGQAMAELQVTLPKATTTTGTISEIPGTYDFPGGILPMSGTTVKPAGGTAMSVDLLRAAVRIDVRVHSIVTSSVTLNSVKLGNVATTVPFFRTQEETAATRAFSAELATITNNTVKGGLYAVETNLDVSDGRALLTKATCLLVNLKRDLIHTGANAGKTWYRINLNVDANQVQYLKRNNVYTVVITGVFAPGASTPEEAYYSEATLIGSITIAGWEESGVPPPDVDIS